MARRILGSRLYTKQVYVEPPTAGASAAVFLDNGNGQVWLFAVDNAGNWAVYDNINNKTPLAVLPNAPNNALRITTGDVNLGIPLTLAQTANPFFNRGTLFYDTTNECPTFYNNDSNVALQIGQEEWVRVVNNTGATITNGSVVYITGVSSGVPTIALAKADAMTTAMAAGIATEDIANGATGFVTNRGIVRGLNTSAYTTGQLLYLSAATAGAMTSTAPVGNTWAAIVAQVVTADATAGTVYVQLSTPVNRAPRSTGSVTNTTSWTINADANDYVENLGLTGAVTINNPTGTPVRGQKLYIVLSGTAARAITWGTAFEASTIALPTTTVGTAQLDIGFRWNTVTSKWRCVGVA